MRVGRLQALEREGKHYVVQTEDLGLSKCVVHTQIIHGGQVVKERAVDYTKFKSSEDLNQLVDKIILRLHTETIKGFLAAQEEDEKTTDEEKLVDVFQAFLENWAQGNKTKEEASIEANQQALKALFVHWKR